MSNQRHSTAIRHYYEYTDKLETYHIYGDVSADEIRLIIQAIKKKGLARDGENVAVYEGEQELSAGVAYDVITKWGNKYGSAAPYKSMRILKVRDGVEV